MNILIVDDEKIIVEGIRLLVLQSGYGVKRVFVAYNGAQALEILKREQVDILFSDIKMPVMDGFELVEQARALPVIPEIVLITGFAEFEYVQRAINSGIVGYLLKPIDEAQFAAVLQKAVNRVIQNRVAAETQAEHADLADKVRTLNMERLLNIVFSGGAPGPGEQEWMEDTLGKTGEKRFQLVTFHIGLKKGQDADVALLIEELKKELMEYFKKEGRTEQFYFLRAANGKDLHCLCVGMGELEGLRSALNWFYEHYVPCVPSELYISMSDVRKKLSRELYTHSQEAYYERYMSDEKRILRYSGADNMHKVSIIENELKILEVHICNGEMAEFQSMLAQVFSVPYIKKSGLTVRAVYFLVCNMVIMTFHRLHMDIPNVTVDDLLSEQVLSSIERVEELAEYIYGVVFDMMMQQEQFNAGTELTIKKIVNYVNVNFHEDLSIKELSARFGLTPNYLSQIFKNETGESFVSYMNRLRIEKACTLLRTSDLKISEIVRQVGYNDSQYFYRVFKKHIGQTPIEYRMGNS